MSTESVTQVAIVTGAASGLGRAIAQTLIERGIVVVGFDIQPCEGIEHTIVDVCDEMSVKIAIEQVVEKFARIDILVNAAGIIHSQPLLNLFDPVDIRHDYQTFSRVVNVGLHAVFLLGSLVAEQMLAKRVKGRIINISSISAKGQAGQSAYAAAKAGVEALTKVWAKELGGFGITVNAIAPGFIDTPSTAKALSSHYINEVKKETPLKKLGRLEHVTAGVTYCIDNDFVNGTVLAIDGCLVV